jgi:hypothetical protein
MILNELLFCEGSNKCYVSSTTAMCRKYSDVLSW